MSADTESQVSMLGVPLRPLDPAWPKADRIGWWVFDGVVLGVSGIPIGITAVVNFHVAHVYLLSSWVVLAGVLLWATLAYPRAAYKRASIAVGDLGIEYRRGVWWRKTTIIPRSRVQHTDVSQGPIMRRFGLGKLVVHTAGTRNAVVEIDGLSFEEAERVRDMLLRVPVRSGVVRGSPPVFGPSRPEVAVPVDRPEMAEGDGV